MDNDSSTAALVLAELGVRVFPCRPLDKRPVLNGWPAAATSNPPDHWFAGGNNLAIRCGRTDTSISIFVVDIDIKGGAPGAESWAEFCDAHPEVRAEAQLTASVSTPSGGWHFYFAVPDGYDLPTNGKPWPGVDIRGEGGYVLAPPSRLENGEYVWVRTIEDDGIMYAPPALMDAVLTPSRSEPAGTPRSVPSMSRPHVSRETFDDNPIDHACDNFEVDSWLRRSGWQPGAYRNNETQFTRPGKSMRDGTSATFHHDTNIVNVYTSTIDPIFEQVGKRSPSSGCYTINGWDAWMIENGYTNVSEAMSAYRRQVLGGKREPEVDISVLVPTSGSTTVMSEDSTSGTASSPMNLPDEFWESRPQLAHIRDAAWATSTSPDAVLAAVLTRYSANLHPSIMLQGWGTLDLFAVIAGHSGSGKSKASKTARMLYPGGTQNEVMMDRQVGSGEGLAEAFFEWRDEDGHPCSSTKKGARKVRTKWGLHFSTDEAVALTASAGRMGSILIPTLCAAWMGESIGQILADPTKSRMIEPNKVRVSAELKIQTMHGWKLFQEEYAATGLSQRMVCFTATDPKVYERFQAGITTPPWPGQLDLPTPFILTDGQPRIMELDDTVAAYLAESAAQAHNPTWAGDPLDTHANLSRLKIAAILALWDDRFTIEQPDFDLAETVLTTHRRIRTVLQSTRTKAESDRRHTSAQLRAETEMVVDEAKTKALLRRTVSVISERISDGKPLGKKYVSAPQRHVYEEAMQMLEAQGLVVETDDGWKAV